MKQGSVAVQAEFTKSKTKPKPNMINYNFTIVLQNISVYALIVNFFPRKVPLK